MDTDAMKPDRIMTVIRRIEAGKVAANRVPAHALFIEVANAYGNADEAREELNRLYREGKIEVGRTVNDRYIRVAGTYYQ
jgi:hypothetical protein